MSAQAKHLEFAPPPAPGTGRSVALALFVHGLLLIALTAGIQWNQDNPLSAEAELWSAVPQAAAPEIEVAAPLTIIEAAVLACALLRTCRSLT